MSSTMQAFYLARAADAGRAADAATLANVRDRFRLSQETWADLAARAGRVDAMRSRLVDEKAAERAAEALAG